MIEHMKMMQIPYLDKNSMLLSGEMPYKTNSGQLFGMGYSRKTNKQEDWGHNFLKKILEFFLFFSVPLKIPGKTKFHSWKFGKIT